MCLKSHYFIFNVITKKMLKLYPENKNGIRARTLERFFPFIWHRKIGFTTIKKKNVAN